MAAPAPTPYTIIGFMTEENASKYVMANPATDDQFYLLVDASRYGTHCVVALVNEKFNKYMIAGLVEEISEYRLTKAELTEFVDSEQAEYADDTSTASGCRGGACFYEGYSKCSGKNVYSTCYGS